MGYTMVFNTLFDENKKSNCEKALNNCLLWAMNGGCIGVDGFLDGVSHSVSESMYNTLTALYVVSLNNNDYSLTMSDLHK